jgi:hypothetical protein
MMNALKLGYAPCCFWKKQHTHTHTLRRLFFLLLLLLLQISCVYIKNNNNNNNYATPSLSSFFTLYRFPCTDHVFDEGSSTQQVYDLCASNIISSALDGRNGMYALLDACVLLAVAFMPARSMIHNTHSFLTHSFLTHSFLTHSFLTHSFLTHSFLTHSFLTHSFLTHTHTFLLYRDCFADSIPPFFSLFHVHSN